MLMLEQIQNGFMDFMKLKRYLMYVFESPMLKLFFLRMYKVVF